MCCLLVKQHFVPCLLPSSDYTRGPKYHRCHHLMGLEGSLTLEPGHQSPQFTIYPTGFFLPYLCPVSDDFNPLQLWLKLQTWSSGSQLPLSSKIQSTLGKGSLCSTFLSQKAMLFFLPDSGSHYPFLGICRNHSGLIQQVRWYLFKQKASVSKE